MKGALVLIGTTAAGWLAWWVCGPLELMAQYPLSVIASGFGYYYTKKFAENHLGL
jgi:hypothetical protein